MAVPLFADKTIAPPTRILVAALGVGVAVAADSDSWLVGLLFGFVVAVWCARAFRDLLSWRVAAFLAVSACAFVFVMTVGRRGMLRWDEWRHYVWLSPYLTAVLLGGSLLPVAQTVLLGTPWRRTLVAIPGVFALRYLHMLVLDSSIVTAGRRKAQSLLVRFRVSTASKAAASAFSYAGAPCTSVCAK